MMAIQRLKLRSHPTQRKCDMKKIIGLGFVLLALPLSAFADTIVFKDGMRLDATRAWEQNGEVQCEINGIVFG